MIDIIGKEQLEEFIWEKSLEKKIIVIYFGAEWCGPCQKLKEKLASVEAKEEMPDLCVAHLDADENENEEVAQTYNVKALPTQIFVSLNGTQIVEEEKIRGYDWEKFVLSYKKLQNKTVTVVEEPVGANASKYD